MTVDAKMSALPPHRTHELSPPTRGVAIRRGGTVLGRAFTVVSSLLAASLVLVPQSAVAYLPFASVESAADTIAHSTHTKATLTLDEQVQKPSDVRISATPGPQFSTGAAGSAGPPATTNGGDEGASPSPSTSRSPDDNGVEIQSIQGSSSNATALILITVLIIALIALARFVYVGAKSRDSEN